MKQTGKCRLCGAFAELRDSHIIPEFFYKPLYNQDHEFLALSSMTGKPVRIGHKGLREKLLCERCEQQFGSYETFAAPFFKNCADFVVNSGKRFVILDGVDYHKLKLFLLSLIWRLGVTSRVELKGALLGDKHEKRIREMLLAENPGTSGEYPCHITVVTHQGKVVQDLIHGPSLVKEDSHHIWRFAIGGFCFSFLVSSHAAPQAVLEMAANESGRLVVHQREISKMEFLAKGLLPFSSAVQTARDKRKRFFESSS
jgi:hypothetical protein